MQKTCQKTYEAGDNIGEPNFPQQQQTHSASMHSQALQLKSCKVTQSSTSMQGHQNAI